MRITVDLDSWWFTDLQRTILAAEAIGLGFPHVLRKSPSKRGYHLIWYNVNVSFEKSLEIRKLLGDDKIRIKLDAERHNKPKQVLFTRKKVYELKIR